MSLVRVHNFSISHDGFTTGEAPSFATQFARQEILGSGVQR